jgi:ABC-type phosphate transport system auxiliary subunit
MTDKLSAKIREFEKAIKDLELEKNKLELFIQTSTAKRADYQAEYDRFSSLIANENMAIKDTLESLKDVFQRKLILEAKLEVIDEFFETNK